MASTAEPAKLLLVCLPLLGVACGRIGVELSGSDLSDGGIYPAFDADLSGEGDGALRDANAGQDESGLPRAGGPDRARQAPAHH